MNWATAQGSHGTTLRPGSRWLAFHLHGFQVREDGARPARAPAAWLSFDSLEATCSEPRIKSSQQWPVLQGPQDGSLELPTSSCPAWASARAPLLPDSQNQDQDQDQDQTEQERS